MPPVSCLAPWMCIIFSDAGYGPCCHHKFPQKKQILDKACASPEGLIALFNDEKMTQLRGQLLNGKLPYNCRVCIKSGYNLHLDDIVKVTKASGALESYVAGILEGIENRERLTGLHPITIHLSKDAPCNLRCTFCEGAPPTPQDPEYAEACFHRLFKTLGTIGWDRINEIYFAGGEPFFNPGLTRFLEKFDWSELDEVSVATVSNATLIHRYFHVLKTINRFYIRLSLDATGETYAKLRRGASWKKAEQNIRELAEIKKDRPNWTVEIHSILMKSTIPFMKEMIRIAHDLGFDFSVNSIRGNYLDENIFFFNDLLEGVNWRAELGEAAVLAREYGFDSALKTLEHVMVSLEKVETGEKADIQTLACPGQRLDMFRQFFDDLKDRRYALWGTDHNLLDFLQKETPLPGLQFIADHSSSLKSYCGYKYIPLSAIKLDNATRSEAAGLIDTVVVNCPTYKAQDVINEAAKAFPDATILARPFWGTETQEHIKALVASKTPYVAFGAGGAGRLMLSHSQLKDSNVVAVADNNDTLHGSMLLGKPVIAPSDIPGHAEAVVIFSEAYYDAIKEQLVSQFGDSITILPLF